MKYKQLIERFSNQVFTVSEKRDSEGRLIRREIINWRKERKKKVYNKNTKKYDLVD